MEDAKLERLIEAQATRIAETLKPEVSGRNRRATTPKFSWEFNLGHVLIVAGMIGSIFMAYAAVRVEITEAKAATNINSVEIANVKRRLDTDIGEIKNALTRIEGKVDAKADKP